MAPRAAKSQVPRDTARFPLGPNGWRPEMATSGCMSPANHTAPAKKSAADNQRRGSGLHDAFFCEDDSRAATVGVGVTKR